MDILVWFISLLHAFLEPFNSHLYVCIYFKKSIFSCSFQIFGYFLFRSLWIFSLYFSWDAYWKSTILLPDLDTMVLEICINVVKLEPCLANIIKMDMVKTIFEDHILWKINDLLLIPISIVVLIFVNSSFLCNIPKL